MKVVTIAALLVLAGCPDKNSPERRMHLALEAMTRFADMMCACKDKACADKVQEAMTDWSTKNVQERPLQSRDQRLTEETMKKMTEVGQRYGECMTQAMVDSSSPVIGSGGP